MLPKSYGRPAAHRVLSTALWIPTVSSPRSSRIFSFTAKPRLPPPLTPGAVDELRSAPGSAVDPLTQLAAVSRCPLSVPRPRILRRNFSPISVTGSVSFGVRCECSTRISSAIDRALPMLKCRYHLNRRSRLTLLPLIRVKIARQDSVVPGPVRIGSAGDERF
jgi:hypothetical protein